MNVVKYNKLYKEMGDLHERRERILDHPHRRDSNACQWVFEDEGAQKQWDWVDARLASVRGQIGRMEGMKPPY